MTSITWLFRQQLYPAALAAGFLLLLTSAPVIAGEPQLLWQANLKAPVHLAPAISGDHLIATNNKGELFAFDRQSGHQKWKVDKAPRFWDRSLATDEQRVFIGRAGGVLQALSIHNGQQQWSLKLAAEAQARPLVVGDTLYVPTTHVGTGLPGDASKMATLYALDSKTGRIKWARRTANYALQKPAFYNDQLFVAGSYLDPAIEVDEGGPMRVNAYSAYGERLWEYKGIDGFIKAVHVDADSVSYVGYQDFITALDRSNGNQLWRLDTGNWTPSLSGADGVIYFGSATTWVYAVNSANGKELWRFNIEGGSFNYLLGEPIRSGERLYFLSQKGDIHALNAATGELIWKKSTGTDSRTGVTVNGDTLVTSGIDGSLSVYHLTPEG